MAKLISASILNSNFSALGEEVKRAQNAQVDWVHLDVMDGRFVPNITFGAPIIESLRATSGLIFDTHLMVEDPTRFIDSFKQAGADIITVHAEACHDLEDCLARIRALGAKAGVSLKPKTPIEEVATIMDKMDLLLLMGVEPGFGGQMFDDETIPKIEQARKLIDEAGHDVLIEVDGGVNPQTAGRLSRAGADVFVAGSFLFRHPMGMSRAVAELRAVL